MLLSFKPVQGNSFRLLNSASLRSVEKKIIKGPPGLLSPNEETHSSFLLQESKTALVLYMFERGLGVASCC